MPREVVFGRLSDCPEGDRAILIKKGTKIVCPLCGEVIGVFTRDVGAGETVSEEKIEFRSGCLRDGELMLCPFCRFPFGIDVSFFCNVQTRGGYRLIAYDGLLIHTDRGWMPFEILTDFVLERLSKWLKVKGYWRREWEEHLEGRTRK